MNKNNPFPKAITNKLIRKIILPTSSLRPNSSHETRLKKEVDLKKLSSSLRNSHLNKVWNKKAKRTKIIMIFNHPYVLYSKLTLVRPDSSVRYNPKPLWCKVSISKNKKSISKSTKSAKLHNKPSN